jgi:hypothetical protein
MSDVVHITGGKVKDCKWSYQRALFDDSGNVKTIVLAQLALTGAKYVMDGKPVSHATVSFGPPPSGNVGKFIKGQSQHHLSVTLPLEDLPRFASALSGPGPTLFEALVEDGQRQVMDFTVKSTGIVTPG